MHIQWDSLMAMAEMEVTRLRESLPDDLRGRMDSVIVFYEEVPSDFLREEGVEEDTLGLFEGPSFGENGGGAEISPNMTLFLLNIWEAADQQETLFQQEVRKTMLHELGHYLGLNEEELAERGLD